MKLTKIKIDQALVPFAIRIETEADLDDLFMILYHSHMKGNGEKAVYLEKLVNDMRQKIKDIQK